MSAIATEPDQAQTDTVEEEASQTSFQVTAPVALDTSGLAASADDLDEDGPVGGRGRLSAGRPWYSGWCGAGTAPTKTTKHKPAADQATQADPGCRDSAHRCRYISINGEQGTALASDGAIKAGEVSLPVRTVA